MTRLIYISSGVRVVLTVKKRKLSFKTFQEENPDVVVRDYEVWGSRENLNLMMEFAKELDVDVRGVPFTVIGEHYVIGWVSDDYSGGKIEEAVECGREESCPDIGTEILNGEDPEVKGEEDVQEESEEKKEVVGIPEKMDLPIIGEIETKDFSLPVLTVVLGCFRWIQSLCYVDISILD